LPWPLYGFTWASSASGFALPFGGLRYVGRNAVANVIGYAMHSSRSHDAVIRVYDAAGNVIETHTHKGDFKGTVSVSSQNKKLSCGKARRLIASVD